jgi:hypothetical protein
MFSLGGDEGKDIFAPGSPRSEQIDCVTGLSLGAATPTTAKRPLHYSAGSDRYTYEWLTDRAWTGTCRRLTVEINDGRSKTADVRFS